MGYSPRGRKESDTTELLYFHKEILRWQMELRLLTHDLKIGKPFWVIEQSQSL